MLASLLGGDYFWNKGGLQPFEMGGCATERGFVGGNRIQEEFQFGSGRG